MLGIGNDGSYAICNTGKPSAFQKEKLKYYIYTDRPVYRAGDSVHYKLVVKKRESRFVPLKNRKIYYEIYNRDTRKRVTGGELSLDEWGTANGIFKINKRDRLGVHEIRAGLSKKDLYGKGRFYVEQYRKPESYFWIWWLTAGSALVLQEFQLGIVIAVAYVIGHWLADLGWFTAVSASFSRGKTLLSQSAHEKILYACGIFLVIFGLYFMLNYNNPVQLA